MKHFAGFAVLVAVAAVLGMPGRISAIQPTLCDAPPLIAASPTASAQLGWSLSADGYWLAAGALQDNAKAGSVALYKNPGTPGSVTNPHPRPDQEITASDSHSGDQFGASVSISGTWLAVGAPGKAQNSGAVYLFKFDGTSWVQMAPTLSAGDAAPGAQFGFSVSLVGSRLVVGAPGDSDRGSLAGSAYVFEMHGNSWNLTKELHADADGRPFDEFGFAVATFDDQIVVGAPFADDLTLFKNFGAAYVFDNPGVASNGWSQAAKLTAEGGFRGDNIQFGASLAMSETQIVVGVPGDDLLNLTDSGSAYVFTGSATSWSPKLLTPEDPGTGKQFGSSVLIDGDGSVVIGSRFDGEDGLKAGAAYLFQNNPSWTESKKYVRPAPGAAFGQSVARLNKQVFMGGYLDDVGLVVDAGSVAVCPVGPAPCPPAPSISRTDHQTIVQPGQTVTYRIDVVAAPAGTTVSGTFSGQLEAVGWCSGANCMNFEPLPFTDTLTVAGGATYLVRGRVRADASGPITSSACVDLGDCHLCTPITDRTAVGPVLVVTKDDGLTQVAPGQTVTYTIKVENVGDGPAPAVAVTDVFSPKLQNVSWTDRTISLAAGQHALFTATGTVAQNACGTLTNQACAQLLPDGPTVCGDDPPDQIRQDVVIALTEPSATCRAISYKVVITNPRSSASGSVQFTTGTSIGLAPVTPLDGRCSSAPGSGNIVCTLSSIPGNGMVTIPVSFVVPECYSGVNPIPVAAVLGSDCDPAHDQVSMAIPVVVCHADLEVEKTGPSSVAPGDSLPYSLKVTNLGPDTACDVVLSDAIQPSLGSPSAPGCTVGPNGAQCGKDKLAPGEPITFGVTFTVPPATPCGSPIVNTATGTASTLDLLTGNNSATVTTAVTCCSPLTISKTDGLTTAMPGQGLLYTIVVSNPGTCPVTGATISDVSPQGLTEAVWCRGSACAPTHPGNLLDTLSLPAGGSETYLFRGVVAESFNGPLINTATATTPAGAVSATDTTEIGFTGVKAFCDGLQGTPSVGGTMTYTVVLINHGPFPQADNPGDEFIDNLPTGLTLTGVSATSGIASSMGNTAKWNGAIPVGGSVTITITAMVTGTLGMTICNQATIFYDADGDGVNESTRVSDDPGEPGLADPCCFEISPPFVPTLSGTGLAALMILLACVAMLRLRRRSL
jgi:uncharacterized repeat protein (TIGR01451 family)